MSNPYRNASLRSDHILGNTYPVILEVRDNLKAIKHVADNINAIRSGNIEIGVTDTWKLQFKYVNKDTWQEIGDLKDLLLYGLDGASAELIGLINALTLRVTAVEQSVTVVGQSIVDLTNRVTELEAEDVTLRQDYDALAIRVLALETPEV